LIRNRRACVCVR